MPADRLFDAEGDGPASLARRGTPTARQALQGPVSENRGNGLAENLGWGPVASREN
jgi:hypothetical protein